MSAYFDGDKSFRFGVYARNRDEAYNIPYRNKIEQWRLFAEAA